MKSEEEIRNRIEELERQAYEYEAGCGDVATELQVEISSLRWVLDEE